MSLIYGDFQKRRILTVLAVLTVCFMGIINLVNGETGLDISNFKKELENSTLNTQSNEELRMVKEYCFTHADQILAGGNPISDLVRSRLVPVDVFGNSTCEQVNKQISINQWDKFVDESRQELTDLFLGHD